jgi:hypothetical protein
MEPCEKKMIVEGLKLPSIIKKHPCIMLDKTSTGCQPVFPSPQSELVAIFFLVCPKFLVLYPVLVAFWGFANFSENTGSMGKHVREIR